MKTFLHSIILLATLSSFAQDYDDNRNSLREAEAKSALNRMQFRANSNTGNYDVKYHRMELNVDPTQAEISGAVTTYFEAKSPMSQIHFDLAANMTVYEVLQRGMH